MGGFSYAPFHRGAVRGVRAEDERLVRRIQREAEQHPTPASLEADAVLRIVVGRLSEGIAELEKGLKLAPDDSRLLSDLAAALVEKADAENDPQELVSALAAADRALAVDRRLPEALFNRALALERLYLRGEALRAWADCIRREARSGWAAEARRHLAVLSGTPEEARFREAVGTFEALIEKGDRGGADRAADLIVVRFRLRSRRYGEEELLARWAEDWRAGRSAEATWHLAAARALGEMLVRHGGDRMLNDTVAAIDRALVVSNQVALSDLATGHVAYRQGLAEYDQYRVRPALAALASASRTLAAAASPLAFWARLFLANCAFQAQHYDEALSQLAAVRRDAADRGYPNLEARALWILGLIEGVRSHDDVAVRTDLAALSLYGQSGEAESAAALHDMLCEHSLRTGDDREAWRHLLFALAQVERIPDARRRQAILKSGASAALAASQTSVALAFGAESVREAAEAHNPVLLSEAFVWQARVEWKAGLARQAEADVQTALAEVETIDDDEVRQSSLASAQQTQGEIVARRDPKAAVPILTSALAIFEQTEYHLKLIETRLARARAYRAGGDPIRAATDLDAGLAELDRQRLEIDPLHRAAFEDAAAALSDERVALQLDRHRPDLAFGTVERVRARLLLDLAGARHEISTIAEVQRRLPGGVVLLEYAALPDCLLLWGVSHDASRFAVLPIGAEDLAVRVAGFRSAVERGDLAEIDRQGSDLDDLLLARMAPLLAPGTLLVVLPDKALHKLPWSALHDRTTGRYRIEDHRLAVAPSACVFLRNAERLRATPRPTAPRLLAVADPAFDAAAFPRLDRLPGAQREVHDVAALYSRQLTLVDRDATRQRVLDGFAGADVVHLALHAVDNPRGLLLARLPLAPDAAAGDPGSLSAYDVSTRRLDGVRLVVLAACDTATGQVTKSEGAASFAWAFLAAGVPAVVADLWAVHDDESARLVVELHRRLLAGASVAEALRQAQLAALHDSDPQLRNPRVWAGFELLGTADGSIAGRGGMGRFAN